jgi:putative intracellular protease/amidase
LGTVRSEDGEPLEIDATLENSPAVLFDALVLAGGSEAVDAMSLDGRTLEFVKDQYRHCKTILALGGSSKLLTKAGIHLLYPQEIRTPDFSSRGRRATMRMHSPSLQRLDAIDTSNGIRIRRSSELAD